MKISLNGNINRTYVQSLCMAFFHGISFSKSDKDDGLELEVSAEQMGNQISASACLRYVDKVSKKHKLYDASPDEKPERALKCAVGQVIYDACREITQKEIEWGILTGIRPSKICAELLQVFSEEKTKSILIDKYYLCNSKADLVIEVTKNEMSIMSLTDNKRCSIYISVPFCPSRCNYCSFVSYVGKKLLDLIPAYVERIIEDIRHTAQLIKELGLELSCIYIGGGTPTILTENQLERVLSAINECIDVSSLDEFTLEGGRPDTLTKGKLEVAKRRGVTRISVNPQTLNNRVLENIGRRHTAEQFFDAYGTVRDSGIRFTNTDLIAGLDGDTIESFRNTIDKIIELSPDNVTVHTFCVKKSAQILRDNKDVFIREDEIARQSVEYAYKSLVANGYEPYYMYRQKNTIGNLENIGYARRGSFGLYNVFMMSDAQTVFGIGAGATTKLVYKDNEKNEILRIFSPKYPYEYLRDNQKTEQQIKEFFDRR